ncbi:MAG: hypothetical protein L0170_07470 [Acidobacteria bacterium]|nr:hypothetical protein [Acidobacteriota bacterium]
MKPSLFASVALATFRAVAWREPSCCPYCPTTSAEHWIRWGFYPRWGEGEKERLAIQRYRCRNTGRTFSLLPDSLLPNHYATTTHILQILWALFVQGIPRSTLAREESIARGTLWHWRRAFLEALPNLRLPGQAAALGPARFLRALRELTLGALSLLFAGWKELEPKHSVVGIYVR